MIVWMWAAVALAAPVRVGTGPLVADGATPAQVRLWIGDEARVAKVTADVGRVQSVTAPGDGTVVVTYVPAVRTDVGSATFTVAVGKVRTTLDVPLVPVASGKIAVTVEPALVKPGEQATLKLVPSGGTPTPGDRRRIALTASSGTVDAPVLQSDGSWIAHWTAPKATTPQAAVITAADADSPSMVWGTAVARVSQKKVVALDAPGGATATLKLGEKTTPASTVKAGKVSFDLELDPAVMTGTLDVARADGTHEEKVVMLPVGTAAVAYLPTPSLVVVGDAVVVRVAGVGADGAPWTSQAPKVTATGASVASVVADGAVWKVTLADVKTGDVVLTTEIAGQRATTKLVAVDLAPRWTASVAPTPLPATGKATATVTVNGPSAPAWSWVQGTGAAPKAAGGAWTAVVPLEEGAPALKLAIGPALPPRTVLAPAAVAGWSDTAVVQADGATSVGLRFAVVDPAGLPVPDAEVELSVVSGDGTLPASKLRTDALGIARGAWIAGKTEGPVTVRATAGGRWTEVALLQVGASGGPDISPDPVGPAARWGAAVSDVTFWREGRAPTYPPVTAGAAVAPVPAAAGVAATSEKAPKVEKTPRPDSDGGGNVSLALTDSHGVYAFEGDGESLVTSAEYGTPVAGFGGLRADVDWPVADGGWGSMAVVGLIHGRVALYAIADEQGASPEIDALAGGRYRLPTKGAFVPDFTLAVGALTSQAFRYAPSGASEGFTSAAFVVRPAFGAGLAVGAVDLRAEVGLAIGPSALGVGGGVVADLMDFGGIRPHIGLDVDNRSWAIERGTSEGELTQTRVTVAVGARFGG